MTNIIPVIAVAGKSFSKRWGTVWRRKAPALARSALAHSGPPRDFRSYWLMNCHISS
jgi:hypothetical protein